MRFPLSIFAGAAIAVLGYCALPEPEANAKASYESSYGYDRTWNASMRLVRVDLGFKIQEKDEGAGYLLFDYTSPESGKKAVPGSIELVRAKDNGVRVIVQIPQMPTYHEQVMVDSLQRKMRAEYGDPPAKAPPSSGTKKDVDAGADAEP
ncbi:MAG: hypothetical protein KIT84_36400 [Labilithrix sp.]|nr:hypothetical protein [Labilithrix sp.]MCW5816537.1 hypothetical protein [Labilithrix sp.]